MFKYISEILGKFSMGQRIIALLLLLLTITIISITPSILDAFTQDNTELSEKIEKQSSEIKTLNIEIDTLNSKIIRNARQCTDDILEREQQIMAEIDRLRNQIENTPVVMSSQMNLYNVNDSNVVTRQPAAVTIEDPRPKLMMDGLKKIKNGIVEDMKNRSGK